MLVHVFLSAAIVDTNHLALSSTCNCKALLTLGQGTEEAYQLFIIVRFSEEPQVGRSRHHLSLVPGLLSWIHHYLTIK